MNVVCMAGNLARDPETKSGDDWQITSFAIAVQRRYKNRDTGKFDADFFECKANNSTAKFIAEHFIKGMRIEITGHLQNEKWTNKEGQERQRDVIFVDTASFAGSGAKSSGKHTTAAHKAESAPQTKKDDSFVDVPEGLSEELPFN